MVIVEKSYSFQAGHSCTEQGRCSCPHGHSYVLIVRFQAPQFQSDCSKLDHAIWTMIEQRLEAKWLNDSLQSENTTLEFVCRWIFNFLKSQFEQVIECEMYDSPFHCSYSK